MAIKRADAAARPASSTRPGVYSRGTETVDAILKAALHVLIEEGASAFTLRRIAQQCGVNVGNVSRHFPRKEMLVQVLLEEILSPSEGLIERNIRETGMSPEDALALVIGGSLDQIESKSMTHLFIELWAMGNHNEFVAERVEGVYRYVHRLIASFVAQLNPALSPEEVDAVALFINASIEGSTMLAGFGKPWNSMMPQMKAIAVRSLVQLAKSITADEIRALPTPGDKPKPARRARSMSTGQQRRAGTKR
jgi:AcrR family transcriptional regulator